MRKNIVIFTVLAAFFVVASVLSAQGRYVRKQMQPNFFIPAKDSFNKQEKLPPLVKKVQSVKIFSEKQTLERETSAEITETAGYMTKFDDYSRDIEYFDNNGEMPQNLVLENDLAEMNSDIPHKIDVPRLKPSAVSRLFDKKVAEVISQN